MVSSWLGFLVSMSFAAEASCFRCPTPRAYSPTAYTCSFRDQSCCCRRRRGVLLGICELIFSLPLWLQVSARLRLVDSVRHPSFFFSPPSIFLEMQNSHFDRRCQAHLTRPATNHGSHTPHLDHSCCIAPHRTTLPHGMAPHGMAPHHTVLRTQCCDAV